MKRLVLLAVATAVLLSSSSIFAADAEDVIYSALFPGLGQFRSGRFTRGTILFGTEMLALGGLWIADLQYDRSVEAYNQAKMLYEAAIYVGDASEQYDKMVEEWDKADRYDTYRKTLLGAAAGIWLINMADMLWGPEAGTPPLSLEVGSDGFIVAGTFTF